MSTYVGLIDVNEPEIQNVQELASIWGDIRSDVESQGGELLDTYALLGSRDFLVLFEADDEEAALKIAVAMERYGLDMETMQAVALDRLGELVEEI